MDVSASGSGASVRRATGRSAPLPSTSPLPDDQAVPLADDVSFEQGACLGIPGITAHRAIHCAGPVAGRVVLVQGGSGAVGQCAIALARQAGATVAATVRKEGDEAIARAAGADHVVEVVEAAADAAAATIRAELGSDVDHIVEVAFDANIGLDELLLRNGGSIASYATRDPEPTVPFWPLLFKNVAIFLLGSDDFSPEAKSEAAHALNSALEGGWSGFEIGARLPLESIADAHVAVEDRAVAGRVIVTA